MINVQLLGVKVEAVFMNTYITNQPALCGLALSFLTALLSGAFTQFCIITWQQRKEESQRKYEIFKILMGGRYDLAQESVVNALNMIDVIFYGEKSVRSAYKQFVEKYDTPEDGSNSGFDAFIKLLEAIAGSLKMKDIAWDDIKRTYYPSRLSERKALELSALENQAKRKSKVA